MKKLTAAVLWLLVALVLAAAGGAGAGTSSSEREYVIAFNQESGLPANADELVANAGGRITNRTPEIGGIVATSTDAGFAAAIEASPQVAAVNALVVEQFVTPELAGAEESSQESPPGPDPQPGTEPFYRYQWDKMRMNASATGSYAVQRGRRDVAVAVLDTGAETTHPDIAPNLDARSKSFVPYEPTISDGNGHGSWNLSAVGAPINSFGMSGVAPNVSLVALKVFDRNGFGSLTWAQQALVYAGNNHFDVAVMSWGVIADHSEHQADIRLFRRALQYARQNGVLPIAALGNGNLDLSDGSLMQDRLMIPGELAGVVGVSATGYLNQKTFYSNYGSGKTDISAPGGDITQPAPGYRGMGRVLGAWNRASGAMIPPSVREMQCDSSGCSYYRWMSGTSMAAPNAAGVAALIVSQYGDFGDGSNKAHMSPQRVEQILQQTANNRPCPEPRSVTYPVVPGPMLPRTATCDGDTGYNNFFGKGIVDALKAVTAK